MPAGSVRATQPARQRKRERTYTFTLSLMVNVHTNTTLLLISGTSSATVLLNMRTSLINPEPNLNSPPVIMNEKETSADR